MVQSKRIAYKKGYKYWTAEEAFYQTGICPKEKIVSSLGFVILHPNGFLQNKVGYAWDGPSGPTFDTPAFMFASLPHDELYQLFREGLLDINQYREHADYLLGYFYRMAMSRSNIFVSGWNNIRSRYIVWAVDRFAKKASSKENRKPILYAP